MNYCEENRHFAKEVGFSNEAVVKAAENVLQFARNCKEKDEACIFDVLMTSVWMTFHQLLSSKFKGNEDGDNIDGPNKVDKETQTSGKDDETRAINQKTESVEAGGIKEATLTGSECHLYIEGKGSPKPNGNREPKERKPCVESLSAKIVELEQSSHSINVNEFNQNGKTKGQNTNSHINEDKTSRNYFAEKDTYFADDLNKRGLVGKGKTLNKQIDEEYIEKQHVSDDSSDDDVIIIEKDIVTIEIDDNDFTTENSNSRKESQQSEEKTFYRINQNNPDSPETEKAEGLFCDMDCENVVDTNSDLNVCDVNTGCDRTVNGETSNLQITNVTGTYNLPGGKDSKDIKYHSELPDGLIIEINMDDNDEASDNESAEMENSYVGIAQVTTHGPKEKRPCENKEQERKSSWSFLKQNSVSKDPLISSTELNRHVKAEPMIIMSNFYNSPVTSTGKVSGLHTRLGPLVSVNAQVQQQLHQHPQYQQFQLQHHHHQQQPHQHQSHSTSFEQQNEELHKAIVQLPPSFMKKLVSDARSQFVVDSKVDFAGLDNVVQQILQFYPFFQGRVEELCLQLLHHNYRLYSGYRAWKEQDKSTQETLELPEGNSMPTPYNFEIFMENADGGIHSDPSIPIVHTNIFGTLSSSAQTFMQYPTGSMVAPQVAYSAETSDKLFGNLNVNEPIANTISVADYKSRSQIASSFSFQRNHPNVMTEDEKCVSSVWGMVGNQSKKLTYQCEKSPFRSKKRKERLQCATITSSEMKAMLKMSISKQAKRKYKKRKETKFNEKSLRNLKQYKTKDVPISVIKRIQATRSAVIKREQNETTNKEQNETTKKQTKRVQSEVVSPNKKKTKKRSSEVNETTRMMTDAQCFADNTILCGSSERGAKIQAQRKLNLYCDMIKEDKKQ